LPPSVNRMSENVGTSTSRKGLHGLYKDDIFFYRYLSLEMSRDSSVSIATGWTAGVRFSTWQDFSVLLSIQTVSGTRPASLQWLPGALSPDGKAAGM
jgi:hypothetical protein